MIINTLYVNAHMWVQTQVQMSLHVLPDKWCYSSNLWQVDIYVFVFSSKSLNFRIYLSTSYTQNHKLRNFHSMCFNMMALTFDACLCVCYILLLCVNKSNCTQGSNYGSPRWSTAKAQIEILFNYILKHFKSRNSFLLIPAHKRLNNMPLSFLKILHSD